MKESVKRYAVALESNYKITMSEGTIVNDDEPKKGPYEMSYLKCHLQMKVEGAVVSRDDWFIVENILSNEDHLTILTGRPSETELEFIIVERFLINDLRAEVSRIVEVITGERTVVNQALRIDIANESSMVTTFYKISTALFESLSHVIYKGDFLSHSECLNRINQIENGLEFINLAGIEITAARDEERISSYRELLIKGEGFSHVCLVVGMFRMEYSEGRHIMSDECTSYDGEENFPQACYDYEMLEELTELIRDVNS